jgi:hypothetical protein
MTNEEQKRLSIFEARLRHLIFLYEEQKSENRRLNQLLSEKEEAYELLRHEHALLGKDYADLKSAMTISLNGSDVNETRLRLSKLVREVDKCITLLND